MAVSFAHYPKVLPQDSDVLCTHPMFGPESGKDGWNDLTFMYEKVRITNEATCSSFLQIFATEDFRVLSEMEVEPTPIDTKGFQKLVQVVCILSVKYSNLVLQRFLTLPNVECEESTSRDSFDLFSGLFIHNRFAKEQLMNIELAVETITQQLVKRMNEEVDPSI
ncbi:hypothetical protein BUALT_Bualt06G0063100 [Buddleja alternifolia]|uniref:TYRAAT2-like C-terminal domain-containing protein n=1 Tax=Buddleja alternifolia TaxID=168488 RepID=A0AAV6XL20_9LAMI|nr:hypothetical protein BUALT_Bualt06G0063100 [Buddleja alternifolia]